ncbi:MAG: hypothetical protein O2890_05290 [Cyanobacteria bacterium]|jgi:multidrug efflux pump subunit AcrB|nr:hypothetical protein [Cyanobacteriota bacterium]
MLAVLITQSNVSMVGLLMRRNKNALLLMDDANQLRRAGLGRFDFRKWVA